MPPGLENCEGFAVQKSKNHVMLVMSNQEQKKAVEIEILRKHADVA
jgi:hypothetical protein